MTSVEIDPLARDNAKLNYRLNQVSEKVEASGTLLSESEPFDLVVANILKPVLLDFADDLLKRLRKEGVLILSGLLQKDVEEVRAKYESVSEELWGKALTFEGTEIGEWRCLKGEVK